MVFRLLTKDKDEIEAVRQAKLLEDEKAQFAVSTVYSILHCTNNYNSDS